MEKQEIEYVTKEKEKHILVSQSIHSEVKRLAKLRRLTMRDYIDYLMDLDKEIIEKEKHE